MTRTAVLGQTVAVALCVLLLAACGAAAASDPYSQPSCGAGGLAGTQQHPNGGNGGDGCPLGSTSLSGPTSQAAATSPTFQISALHGTLRLPGTWWTDSRALPGIEYLITPDRDFVTQAAGGAEFRTELVAFSRTTTVAIVSFPIDSTGIFSRLQWPEAGGGPYVRSQIRNLMIAGDPAKAQDFASQDPSGTAKPFSTLYVVHAGDRAVVIYLSASTGSTLTEFSDIEKALVAIH